MIYTWRSDELPTVVEFHLPTVVEDERERDKESPTGSSPVQWEGATPRVQWEGLRDLGAVYFFCVPEKPLLAL